MLRNDLRVRRGFCIFVMLMTMTGCEAPLDLKGVEKVSERPVKRFDQFLSAAKNDRASVVVSSAGAVLVTSDEGKQWTRHDLTGVPNLIEVVSCPDGSFAALDTMRRVWVSADDGNTWNANELETPESMTTLSCDPGNRLWAGGSFTTLMSSTDKGETWETTSFDQDAMFTALQFVDHQFGVAVGEFGTVAITENGGESWEIGPSISNEFYPQAALFLDRENGYVVGLNGKILRTSNGGASWVYEDTPTDAPLYGLARQGVELFVVGEGGVMLHRKDDRWERVNHDKPVGSYLRTALPVNDQELLIAGGAGALFLVSTPN
jgi:photosystem II stability/assembly factor-like uncharacterized protein